MLGQKFVHLHTHSHYSILDGLSSPEELAKQAREIGYGALALTDHGTCGGVLNFQKACADVGIKPILGMETYITEDHQLKDKNTRTYHLVLLAKNRQGLKNLMQLSSIAGLEGFYRKPRIDIGLLETYGKGLICLSACPVGELAMALWEYDIDVAKEKADVYKQIFGDDYYIEIMFHKYNKGSVDQQLREKKLANELLGLAKDLDIKAVATNDIHYARKEQAYYHDVLLAMQTKTTIKDPKRFSFDSEDFYMKSPDEMAQIFGSQEHLLTNTVEVAEKIEDDAVLDFSEDLLPHYSIPPEFATEEAYLKKLVSDGMKSKGFMDKPEYCERIKFEMNTIIKCGYTRYFLILWDVINHARQKGIRVGAGRGSAVGSLCLYVLGITKLDPIKYDLLFERFLNPDRISPPDVDVDFDYDRRDEIYEYMRQKYGNDNCSKIGTYSTFKARATVRYIVKALDLGHDWERNAKMKQRGDQGRSSKRSLDIADKIAKLVPGGPGVTLSEVYKENAEFRAAVDRYPEVFECMKNIEGAVSHAGVHAAGFMVCKNPVTDTVPLRESQKQICSQFVGEEVEELGLLKFDFLALKTLTLIENTVQLIKKRRGKTIRPDLLEPNDEKVFAMLNGQIKGVTNNGIFQFESEGISALMSSVHVDEFEDMIVTNALYRPGPLGAGVHKDYCDYKHGRKKMNPRHPKMGEVLKKSYGIMVYQEDVMKVSREIAGFTRGQSDTLRKAVGKKKEKLMKELHEQFIKGCQDNGISGNVAEDIWRDIEYFGGYGFNKSHSAAYSFISYQCAWLKVHYPLEFMCNLLTSEISNSDQNEKLNAYAHEAKRMGMTIARPNINRSKEVYTVEDCTTPEGKKVSLIRTPLSVIKGVGFKAAGEIVSHQPYKNLKEFVRKVDGRKITSAVFEPLVKAGCMDKEWEISRDEMFDRVDSIKKQVQAETKQQKKVAEYRSNFGGSIFDAL